MTDAQCSLWTSWQRQPRQQRHAVSCQRRQFVVGCLDVGSAQRAGQRHVPLGPGLLETRWKRLLASRFLQPESELAACRPPHVDLSIHMLAHPLDALCIVVSMQLLPFFRFFAVVEYPCECSSNPGFPSCTPFPACLLPLSCPPGVRPACTPLLCPLFPLRSLYCEDCRQLLWLTQAGRGRHHTEPASKATSRQLPHC